MVKAPHASLLPTLNKLPVKTKEHSNTPTNDNEIMGFNCNITNLYKSTKVKIIHTPKCMKLHSCLLQLSILTKMHCMVQK